MIAARKITLRDATFENHIAGDRAWLRLFIKKKTVSALCPDNVTPVTSHFLRWPAIARRSASDQASAADTHPDQTYDFAPAVLQPELVLSGPITGTP